MQYFNLNNGKEREDNSREKEKTNSASAKTNKSLKIKKGLR
jgi:hypothetical protein